MLAPSPQPLPPAHPLGAASHTGRSTGEEAAAGSDPRCDAEGVLRLLTGCYLPGPIVHGCSELFRGHNKPRSPPLSHLLAEASPTLLTALLSSYFRPSRKHPVPGYASRTVSPGSLSTKGSITLCSRPHTFAKQSSTTEFTQGQGVNVVHRCDAADRFTGSTYVFLCKQSLLTLR